MKITKTTYTKQDIKETLDFYYNRCETEEDLMSEEGLQAWNVMVWALETLLDNFSQEKETKTIKSDNDFER